MGPLNPAGMDVTAHYIYGHADSVDMNSWLRTLSEIRQLPTLST